MVKRVSLWNPIRFPPPPTMLVALLAYENEAGENAETRVWRPKLVVEQKFIQWFGRDERSRL